MVATKKKARKASSGQQPSETYAARMAEGRRRIVSLSLSANAVELLRATAEKRGTSMSAVVEAALELLVTR